MGKKSCFLFLLLWCFLGSVSSLHGQNKSDFRILFYNVENLFDTFDDPLTQDEEFLPNGEKHWNWGRYNTKLQNLSKVIAAAGAWQQIAVIGLCEVENRKVLEDLTQKTGLKQSTYGIVHKESPDKRGIDVALLYREEEFYPLSYHHIPVVFSGKYARATRDILYVCGKTNQGDTLHFFVNHWPSRWGGQMKTEKKRMFVANILKQQVDSLYRHFQQPNIIIMGDLNDTPKDRSVKETLKTSSPEVQLTEPFLIDMLAPLENTEQGTHCYRGKWSVLDHFIISPNLLNEKAAVYTTKEDVYPFSEPFMLEKNGKYNNLRPKRSYLSYKYNGGFSDHLPIVMNLFFSKK